MAEVPDAKVLQEQLRAGWIAYLDLLLPIRSDLHAYCRRLTGNVWDAEDLIQDTLVRGFGHLSQLGQEVENVRAYMLRAASNTWIDGVRRRTTDDPPRRIGAVERIRIFRPRYSGDGAGFASLLMMLRATGVV